MNEDYNRLIELKEQYPELTFDNDGYEYLSPEIKKAHADQIKEICAILSKHIPGFSRFDNFKPSKQEDTFSIRCHYNYGHNSTPYFIGVGYFPIEDFKDEITEQ